MKLYKSVHLSWSKCPRELRQTLPRVCPEGVRELVFHMEAKAGDDRAARMVDEIVSLFEEAGLDKGRSDFSLTVSPVYEPADLAAAPMLLVEGARRRIMGADNRDPDGRLCLPAPQAKANLKIAVFNLTQWLMVSDAVRGILEAGSFLGLVFGEVHVRGKSIHAAPGPFWELKSSITLPAMTNAIPILNSGPPRFALGGEFSEAHYRESELRAVGAFDIAYTREVLACRDHAFVISQRFYQHCRKHKIPLEVRPCRIEPG